MWVETSLLASSACVSPSPGTMATDVLDNGKVIWNLNCNHTFFIVQRASISCSVDEQDN